MYLVDGNNVMGQRVGWHRDKPRARRRLLDDLARLVKHGEDVCVVFDGRPDEGVPDGSSYRGVQVFFAGPESIADDRIVEIVEEEQDRDGLTVITSDRELTTRVRSFGRPVLRSGEFRRRMLGD